MNTLRNRMLLAALTAISSRRFLIAAPAAPSLHFSSPPHELLSY